MTGRDLGGGDASRSHSREHDVRAHCLGSDRRVVTGLIVIMILFVMASVPSTLALRENPAEMYFVWTLRAVTVAVAAGALMLVRRVESTERYDVVVTVWLASWFCGVVIENALLPAALTSFIAWDVFIVVSVFAVPLPLRRQILAAAIVGVGDVAVLWTLKDRGPALDVIDVTLAYACAFTVGVFVSRTIQGCRTTTFHALTVQVEANAALQEALREVRTLRGIIPICSFCKNIRTEAGDWQLVEAYVRDRSDADFSHGVCPECMQAHYPGVAVRC